MGIFGQRPGDSDTTKTLPSQDSQKKDSSSLFAESTIAKAQDESLKAFKIMAYETLMERIDLIAANQMTPDQLRQEVEQFIIDLSAEKKLQLNSREQRALAASLVDDMIGLGPLEEIIHDDSVTDILINGPRDIYIERRGKLSKTSVRFHDEAHLQQIARRIAGRVGRRVDESSPMVDARLADGSRVNIIMPPLALDGTSISIRKFSRTDLTLDKMVTNGNISQSMAKLLKIAASSRLNTLISGGTGSGKTTLLNALSQLIDPTERIITIEDSAELRLQQPHVVRLESRPPNIEGEGEITIRELVRNALRMRPDRIIVGEVRGEETIDMLQAMNTGHDGSMSTIHANRPREVLTRLENMMMMSGFEMPPRVIRAQIVGAINLIVHIERMRDGVRRVTEITEITGMEEDVIVLNNLFKFEFQEEVREGDKTIIKGAFKSSGLSPNFAPRAIFYGLEKELKEVLKEG
jgi:pilus assembly protein CpaF